METGFGLLRPLATVLLREVGGKLHPLNSWEISPTPSRGRASASCAGVWRKVFMCEAVAMNSSSVALLNRGVAPPTIADLLVGDNLDIY